MSKTPAKKASKPKSTLGVTFKGGPKEGHGVTVHGADTLKNVFNTKCQDQADAFLAHCVKVLRDDEAGDAGEFNDERAFMLSIVNDIAPRDTVERMLAVQMAATHVAAIRSARQLAFANRIEQVQACNSGFNKLTRTFAAQMEALRKHRNGGKQTVTVQHVNVEDGGQAIVGNVQHRGRGSDEK